MSGLYSIDKRCSGTHRSKEKKCAIRPTASILFLITLRRSAISRSTGAVLADADPPELSISSSCVHILSTAASISVTGPNSQRFVHHLACTREKKKKKTVLFSPTNGRLQLNASMKFGSQYGCGMLLNCRMLNMFASYLTIAALLLYTSR